MAITDFLKKTKTAVYDPSSNSVSIAGIILDGVTNISIKYPDQYKTVEGVNGSYTAVVRLHDKSAKLSVDLLPTAQCLANLHKLMLYIRQNGGMFEIIILNNGVNVLQGVSWFLTIPDYTLTQDATDVNYTFGVNLYKSPTFTQSRNTDTVDKTPVSNINIISPFD